MEAGRVINEGRPFTPQTLAERWECTPQHIRDLIDEGKLKSFRLGRLIRIPAAQVQRYEECDSSCSEADGTSSPEKAPAAAGRPSGLRIVRRPSAG